MVVRPTRPERGTSPLREVVLGETTMRRWGRAIYRKDSQLPPAAQRLLGLLCARGKTIFQQSV
jgi:hypothetical protein